MSPDVFQLLKAGGRLPTLPAVAVRVLELARGENNSLAEIAEAISADPALAARILRFVNSPFAGNPRQVTSLNRAVCLLGLRGVQTIALSFSLVSNKHIAGCPSFDLRRFWSQSLACAVADALIAQSVRKTYTEEAFATGLLSRIGQLVFACGIPKQYEQVLRTVQREGGDLLTVERRIIGSTHLEIGAMLLSAWELPETIWQPIRQQLEIDSSQDSADGVTPARILYVADLAAMIICGTGSKRARLINEVGSVAHRLAGIDATRWGDLFDQIARRWADYGRLLEVETSGILPFEELVAQARQLLGEQNLASQLGRKSPQSQIPDHVLTKP